MSGWEEGGEEKRVWKRSVSLERTYCRIGGRVLAWTCLVSGCGWDWEMDLDLGLGLGFGLG